MVGICIKVTISWEIVFNGISVPVFYVMCHWVTLIGLGVFFRAKWSLVQAITPTSFATGFCLDVHCAMQRDQQPQVIAWVLYWSGTCLVLRS